ncbi:hypothetical protein ACWEK5_47170, partial [Rhodococcus koreensis]
MRGAASCSAGASSSCVSVCGGVCTDRARPAAAGFVAAVGAVADAGAPGRAALDTGAGPATSG